MDLRFPEVTTRGRDAPRCDGRGSRLPTLSSASMKVDFTRPIAGLPAFSVRRALRDRVGRQWSGADLAADLRSDASYLLGELAHEGLIESGDAADVWSNTIKGNAFAQARARRVSRATAQRHLDAFLERVEALRSDPRFLYRVERVALFGSFVDPNQQDVGDVDLVAEYVTKEPNWDRHLELEERYREAEDARGRTFRGFIDRLLAPRIDPRRFLKGRSSVLSIHDADEYEVIPLESFRVIYEDPADEPDRTQPPAEVGRRRVQLRGATGGRE
jgi:predicted nucleotidyltransferase